MKHDRNVLAEHGTELMTLKPRNILQAAEADIRRHRHNVDEAEMDHPSYEHYAFHRHHVRKAVDAGDLLVRALMDPLPGLWSGKFNTRLIYGNAALLLAAVRIAREQPLVDRACAMLDGTCDCPREEGQSFPNCQRHS